jgi:predicted flap endonuclease-1-like 5' DNA nuclease
MSAGMNDVIVKPVEREALFTALERWLQPGEAPVEDVEVTPLKPRPRTIKIITIEGIGPVYAETLAQAGIKTTEDLLKVAATRKGREELVEKTGISGKFILKWVNRADLMRVPGIGEEYSDLLEAAGVDTVRELRNRNPENLYNKMCEINEQKRLVRRTPHQSEVTAWVEAAKTMEPLVTY